MFGTSNGIAGQVLVNSGTEEQKAAWLPRLASGEIVGAFALTEAEAGSDPSTLSTSAVRDGDDYVIDGAKRFITNAPEADVFMVFARTGGAGSRGISTFLVESGTEIFSGAELLLKGCLETPGGVGLLTGYPGSPVAGFFDSCHDIAGLLQEKGVAARMANNEALSVAMVNGAQMVGVKGIAVLGQNGIGIGRPDDRDRFEQPFELGDTALGQRLGDEDGGANVSLLCFQADHRLRPATMPVQYE